MFNKKQSPHGDCFFIKHVVRKRRDRILSKLSLSRVLYQIALI